MACKLRRNYSGLAKVSQREGAEPACCQIYFTAGDERRWRLKFNTNNLPF